MVAETEKGGREGGAVGGEEQEARHLMKRVRYANEVLRKVLERRREGGREGGRR